MNDIVILLLGAVLGIPAGIASIYYVENRKKRRAIENAQKQAAIYAQENNRAKPPPGQENKLPNTPKAEWWTKLTEEAQITAIVSGKGGVGKSTIALGLLEYYSMDETVLLIDFDLQNMGLSSVFGHHQNDASMFDELVFFQKILPSIPGIEELRSSPNGGLSNISKASFEKLRNTFAMHDSSPRKLQVRHFDHGKQLRVPQGTVQPGRCAFINSRIRPSRFLASDPSTMDYVEIAFFLKCFAHWAHRALQVSRIVLDCHGGQDMFMVGASLAARDLVVVATTEPGAIVGTCELLDFSKTMVSNPKYQPDTTILVINKFNKVHEEDHEKTKREFLHYAGSETTVIEIEQGPEIEELNRFYTIPRAANTETFWPAICAIAGRTSRTRTAEDNEKSVEEEPEPQKPRDCPPLA